MSEPKIRCLSLGAGVQSTTLALMAARGEISPMPDCAIFADTQWEPAAVYAHLDRLEAALPFPVYRVTAGSLRSDLESGRNSTGQRFSAVPWWVRGGDGREVGGRRQCTKEYKLVPIARKIRELLGAAKGERVPAGSAEVWIGISTDEAMRMKPSRERWKANRWPLIEAGMSRYDCRLWMERHGWTAPRSACIGCPYRGNAEWRALLPDEFADAVRVDVMIRGGARGPGRSEQYAHRSLVPLGEADLRSDTEKGQGTLGAWGNECEGMCGV